MNNTGNTTQLLTSFNALDVAQQKVLLSSKLLTEEQKSQCATMVALSSVNSKYTAEQLTRVTGVSAETLANWGLVDSTDSLTIAELAELAVSDKQAKNVLDKIIAQNAQAVANGEVTASNIALASSEGGATLATGAFTTAIKANISAMWTWMTTTPLGWLTLLAAGVFVAVKAYDALTISVEEQKEKMEESLSAYEDAKSELSGITTELENQEQAMNELLAKEKLTYAEKGQLEELQAITRELRIQKDLAEKEEDRTEKQLAKDATDLFDKQFGDYEISEQTINKYQSDADITGNNAILISDENDISAMIAGYKQFNELLDEAYGSGSQDDIDHFKSLTEDLEDSIFTTAQELQTQQDNISAYYESIKNTPYEDLTTEQKEIVDTYNAISNAIALIYQQLDPNTWNSMQVDNIFSTDGIEKTKDELVAMAQSGELTPETIKGYTNLNNALGETTLSAQDLCDELYAIADAQGEVQGSTSEKTDLFTNLTTSKDALEDFISAVESASNAYSTLMNPNVSTSDMLSSILSITEAVSEMGGKLNWEFIESSDNSLKLLGDTIDYVSEKYTKSALVDAGFGEEFAEVLANSIVESQKAARELENVNTQIDSLQVAYDDLTDIVKTYNKTGYITFDQLQTLLEMEPQYLACLVDENGQLRLNQQSMLELANMRLNEAQAQAVQQAISELGALAIQNETTAIEDNEDAREEQLAKIEEYNSRLAESIAETSVETALIRELNEEMGNASSNGASDEQINTVLDNLNTKLQLINKTREGLTGNFGKIVSSSSSSAKDDFEETFNWVETIISRIQRTITNLGKTVSATYKKWSTRNNALAQEMSAINQEIAAQQNAYNTYMSKANSVNLSEHYKELVRNGGFSIEDITDETLAENIKLYQEWYDKALECSDAIDDLRGNLAELAMTKFENVSKEYDDRLALIEHHTSMLDGYVSRAEAAGFWVSEVYYQKMAEKELENINQLQGKYNDLIATFNENVSNGSIEKYSEDWYEMRIEIDDVESALQEANTALVEFNQTLQQIHWDLFDRVNDYKDALIEESNFLAEMISRDDLYNTYGSLTDEGLAVQGLHAVNYNAYMEKAADYAEEIQKINEEIANDPNDLELVDRRNELLNLQQESIENAMAEKDAIRDLISDGYDIMLDSLDELINKRKEALNAEKDLYDYQNSIKEKTDTISSYRKQLDAYSGDNSEEARATIQKLQLGLEEAENDLQETEYEKWLSDQEAMLDDLYDQTEEWINGRLDNIDGLVSEAITATNENASTISETIFSTADTLGYSLSEYANTLWSSASDNTDTLVKAYENVAEGISGTISNGITTLQTVLDSIDLKMQSMIEDLNTQATVESESIGQSQVQIVEEQNNYNTGDASQSSQPSSSGIVFTGGTFYEDSYKGGKTGNSKQQWTDHEVEITGESSTGMVHIVDKTTGTILGWVDKDQLQGYATGTTNAKKGLNLVSEMGDEIIQDNDGNIILAKGKQFFPFDGGETVFDASETAELLKGNLIPLNTEQLWGDIIKTPDYSGLMARSGNVANDIQLNIAVKANNYDEFVSSFKTAIKSDPQCRKLLQAVTVDELTNKGGLSRNKF